MDRLMLFAVSFTAALARVRCVMVDTINTRMVTVAVSTAIPAAMATAMSMRHHRRGKTACEHDRCHHRRRCLFPLPCDLHP